MLPRLGDGSSGWIALPVSLIPGGERVAPGPGFGFAQATMLAKKNTPSRSSRCFGPVGCLRGAQAAEMLNGAAGKLVGIGSAWPSASALARRYISLWVAPWASIAAATTAQLRISVVMSKRLNEPRNCGQDWLLAETEIPTPWLDRGARGLQLSSFTRIEESRP